MSQNPNIQKKTCSQHFYDVLDELKLPVFGAGVCYSTLAVWESHSGKTLSQLLLTFTSNIPDVCLHFMDYVDELPPEVEFVGGLWTMTMAGVMHFASKAHKLSHNK